MDKEPQEPSGKTELSEESDRLRVADYGEIAFVAVAEGRGRAAVETSLDGARHVASLLHGDRCRARGGKEVLALLVEGLEGDGLVFEHDGDRVPDRVEKLAVFSQEPGVDLFLDRLAAPVLHAARRDLLVDAVDRLAFEKCDGLLGLWSTENFE